MAYIIDSLRVINLIALLIAMAILFKPAQRSFTANVQKGDVLWFLFWGDAFNRVWFVARSISFGGATYVAWEAEILALCYLFAILVEALVIRAYLWGRQ